MHAHDSIFYVFSRKKVLRSRKKVLYGTPCGQSWALYGEPGSACSCAIITIQVYLISTDVKHCVEYIDI